MFLVNTLGRFCITNEEVVLNEDGIRSPMLTKLLLFMVTHREQTLTTDEIATAIWQEEEVDNPAGALKNLMYRLRTILKKTFGETEFIQTSRGSYCWNPQVEVVLDVEQFEEMTSKARNEKEDSEQVIQYYEAAVRLYQGDFMPKLTEMHWVVTTSTYYHSMYLSAIKAVAELYIAEEKYDELESLCNEALDIDNLDEQIHYYLIYARMKNQNMQLAMQSYEKACEILHRELGVRNPEKLREIHEELLKMNKGIEAENMETVQEDMTETHAEGTFFCGYPVFREIYRLEARKIARSGGNELVLLLTIKQKDGAGSMTEQMESFRTKKAMEDLEEILNKSLRIGDVAAKYSDSQFIVLLPSCTYEGGVMVAERIVQNFYGRNSKMQIEYDLEAVTATSKIVQ